MGVTGEGLTYQWQWSKNGSYWGTYNGTGSKTAEMSVVATAVRNGYYYRCIITDAEGNTVMTEAVQLTVAE